MNPPETLVQEFLEDGMGTEPEVVVSAPGRVNLLGQHIDHQGGFTNPIAIDRRIHLAAARIDVPVLRCRDADPRYVPFELDLREAVAAVQGKSWDEALALGLVDSLPGVRGSWARYVLGSLLYLANRGLWNEPEPTHGFVVQVKGDIPPAAGLSSSSALVVASLLAFLDLFGIEKSRDELVPMAGEAEFFAGTRGGCGDHAAILLAHKGAVSHFAFHPFRLIHEVAFPDEYRVVVCHSGHGAEKSTTARVRFNHRVMAYHLGRLWMKKVLPKDKRNDIATLRDFLPADTRALSGLYKLLRKLPEEATAAEVRAFLDGSSGGNDEPNEAEPFLAQISEEEPLDLRGTCLFGLAEMTRAGDFAQYLEHGRMDRVTEIMSISHDGDRVTRFDAGNGTGRPFFNDYSDGRMSQLAHAAMFDWGNPDGAAQLWRQPGRYHSSTPRLDLLVDLVKSCSPRSGAHLVGAGLGGAIAALCQAGDVERIVETVEKRYYAREGLETLVYVFQPEEGATVVHSKAREKSA